MVRIFNNLLSIFYDYFYFNIIIHLFLALPDFPQSDTESEEEEEEKDKKDENAVSEVTEELDNIKV